MNALDRMAGGPDDNAAQAGHLVPIHAVTLTNGGHPNSNMPGRRKEDDVNLVPAGASVRRLTPRECERLQGFPDDWTLIQWKSKPAPDSRRYAACGDAVTVPVAEWVGRRIAGALEAVA